MAGYRDTSMWFDLLEGDLAQRPPLPGDGSVDVAIAGGGYTGLWTAYYLKKADPSLRIAILEKDICGFGASGRNGGWCSALFATGRNKLAKEHGRHAAVRMQRAMFSTVDEVGRVLEDEKIDANFVKGGTLTLATKAAHVEKIKDEVADEHSWGFDEEDFRWLDADETAARIRVQGALGAAFTPHCARVQPAALVRGLADVAETLGVEIYEGTEVERFEPRKLVTAHGEVRADVVVRATEGYTVRLPRMKRRLLPVYSLMVGTEPLPEAFWDEIGWANYETVTDGRQLLIYAQRTHDDRIAFGGRGAPYHFGSRIDERFDREPRVFHELWRSLTDLWPGAADFTVTHEWGGPLGIPRDWSSSVGFEQATGIAWAGGYVGDGVSTTNLAGRTLADLILERGSDLVSLPWVGHVSRRWEPEPLRWVGVNLMIKAIASADVVESRTGRPSRRVRWADRLIGH